MQRLIFILFLASCFFLVTMMACDSEDEDEGDDDEEPADDDDTEEPGYLEPWNQEPTRPHLSILTPTPGTFVTEEEVAVQGLVTGMAVEEIRINGEAVPVIDGGFQLERA